MDKIETYTVKSENIDEFINEIRRLNNGEPITRTSNGREIEVSFNTNSIEVSSILEITQRFKAVRKE